AEVPVDATEAWVSIGLEETSGTAWFDDVKVIVSAVPRTRPTMRPAPLPTSQLDRRTELPRLRGVMYGPKGKADDIRKLAEWNANLIRWQLYYYAGTLDEHRRDLA